MPTNQRLEYSYDVISDVLTIQGIKYAAGIFHGLAFLPIRSWIRLVPRHDGVLTLESPQPPIEDVQTVWFAGLQIPIIEDPTMAPGEWKLLKGTAKPGDQPA